MCTAVPPTGNNMAFLKYAFLVWVSWIVMYYAYHTRGENKNISSVYLKLKGMSVQRDFAN